MILVAETYDDGSKFIPLYRHCDGYLTGAGSTIAEALGKSPVDAESLLALLLAERYDDEGADRGPVHRAATWQPDEQSDLEYVYVIRAHGDGGRRIGVRNAVAGWTVTVHARFEYQPEGWREWPATTYTLAELEAALVRERSAEDARRAAYAARGRS
jgi:hypothetical protein